MDVITIVFAIIIIVILFFTFGFPILDTKRRIDEQKQTIRKRYELIESIATVFYRIENLSLLNTYITADESTRNLTTRELLLLIKEVYKYRIDNKSSIKSPRGVVPGSTESRILTENYDEDTKRVAEYIMEIESQLEKEEEEDPLKGLPQEERNVMNDIKEMFGTKINKGLNRKLAELANLIKVRQETIEKIGKENEEARKRGKKSYAWTIVFGIITIVSLGFAV